MTIRLAEFAALRRIDGKPQSGYRLPDVYQGLVPTSRRYAQLAPAEIASRRRKEIAQHDCGSTQILEIPSTRTQDEKAPRAQKEILEA